MADYDYRDVPTVRAFSECDAFFRGLMGCFGGGKSSGCVMEIPARGVAQVPGQDGVRRSRFVAVRNSYRQLEDSTIKTFLQWFPPYKFGTWKPSDHIYTLKAFKAAHGEPNAEIEVQFRALDRPDQVGNLLSTEYTGAWVNEARDIPWAVIDALSGRVGRDPAMRDGGPTWCGIVMDTNPPDTESEWYRFFEEKDHTEDIERLNRAIAARIPSFKPYTVDSYVKIFKQPSGLSPNAENLKNLPPGYYERLAVGKSDDWVKIYIHGEYGFTQDGKPVFPEYSEQLHCPDDAKLLPKTVDGVPLYISFDFGLTPAAVFGQITPNGRWIIVDELVADDMGFDQFSDLVLLHVARFYRGLEIVYIGDPAGQQRSQSDEKTCFQIGAAKGMQIQPAPQTLRLRLEGTRKPMRMTIDGRPQFQLHPRCKRLRKALNGGYHYRRVHVSGERYEESPNKNQHSHVADALTYQGAWLFGQDMKKRPVEDYDYSPGEQLRDTTRSRVTGY